MVAEYVLPKFDVTIDSPTQFSAKDEKIRAIVRAKYTYGKFVKGEALVSITNLGNNVWWDGQSNRGGSVIKSIKIDGKGLAEFDIQSSLQPIFQVYQSYMNYRIQATVIEELTGE